MSLELLFKVNDGGSKQSIEGIGSAISTLAARTKVGSEELGRWQSVVKGSVEAGYSLSKSIDIANKTFEKGGVPIKAFTAGIKEQIAEVRKLGNTLQSHTVPQVAAASAALRTLEGSLSIRAAERFLTTIGGIGPILQAAFPVFGALALVEIIGRMAEKVGEVYNAWDPVIHAEKESLQIIKDSIPELKKLVGESEKLTDQARKRQFGSAYALRLESDTFAHDAASDQRNIDNISAKIKAAQAVVAAGTIAGTSATTVIGKGGAEFTRPGTGGGLTIEARAAQEKLIGLSAQLENATLQKKVDALKSEDAKAELSKETLQKERERQSKIEGINKTTDQIKEHTAALSDKAELSRFGAIGELEAGRRAMERRHLRESEDLNDQIRINRLGGPDTVRAPDSTFVSQRTAIQGSLAADRSSFSKELAAAAFKQAEEYKIENLKFQKYDQTHESPGIAAFQKLLKGATLDDLKKAEPGFRADEEIRRIGLGTQKEGIQRQFSSAQSIASNSTFNQYDAISSAAKLRIELAGKLRDLELESAKQIEDKDQRRVANARALADFERDRGEAELERQQKLIELDHKRQEEFRTFSQGIFGAITSHDPTTAIRSFAIGKGRELGSAIFGNAAGALIAKGGPLAGAFGNLGNLVPGQGESPDKLTLAGKLLQNTPLGKVFGDKTGINEAMSALPPKLDSVASSLTILDTDIKALNQTLVSPQVSSASGGGSSGLLSAAKGLGGNFSFDAATLSAAFPGSDTYNPETGVDDGGYQGPRIGSPTRGANAGPSSIFSTGARYAAGVGAAAFGIQSAFKGFSRGTAQGDLNGIAGIASTVAGTALMFGPAGAPVAAIAAGIGAGIGLISSLIGDPKKNFADQQQRDIRANTYFAPQSVSVTSDTSGRLVDYGANGLPRGGSPYGAFDFTQQLGYFSHKNDVYTQVPGYVTPGFNAPPAPVAPPNPAPPVITIRVSTMDAASFAQNGPMIADVIKAQLQQGHSVRREIASVANLRS